MQHASSSSSTPPSLPPSLLTGGEPITSPAPTAIGFMIVGPSLPPSLPPSFTLFPKAEYKHVGTVMASAAAVRAASQTRADLGGGM